MQPINIRYSFRPVQRSLATGQLADLFGLDAIEPDHVIAEQLELPIYPNDLVLFTGPSGSGKSSILRAAAQELNALDAMQLLLPTMPLIETLPGSFENRMALLAACGLSEARLLLRTPNELSDGQRYRFRLALALTMAQEQGRAFLVADEFAAYLDRTLAKVLAFNIRKIVSRSGIGILLATTHEDLTDDLAPDLHVRCHGEGHVSARRLDRVRARRTLSFAGELHMEEGTAADWPAFAQ